MAEMSERSRRARAAMRVLHEVHGADLALIAEATLRSPTILEALAAGEGWRAKQGRVAESRTLSERIGALAERLVGEIEAIERDGASSGYDKARIDAVTALTRALEKAGEIGEARQERQREQKKTDAEIAELLGRMEDRIIELARMEADRLVAAERAGRKAGDAE